MSSINSNAVKALAATSIFWLINLIVSLAIPITELVIGLQYRDPRYCPIEPRISLFLIVGGSGGLTTIVVTILITVLAIVFASNDSLVIPIILGIILFIIVLPGALFSLVWFIIGSVWTFSIHHRVIHEYDTVNDFYTYDYCHPVLYKFTFIILIMGYVGITIQCCYNCFTCVRRVKSEL